LVLRKMMNISKNKRTNIQATKLTLLIHREAIII